MTSSTVSQSRHTAFMAAGGTVFIWGMSGTYFFFLSGLPPLEILAHRVVWSAVILGIVLIARGRFGMVRTLLRNSRARRVLLITACLISFNWGLFIWAVGNGLALECSMAYFISPLLVVLLAALFLREKLSRREKIAIAVICVGVGFRIIVEGAFSWVPFVTACTFAAYVLLRKTTPVDSIAGLFLETMLLFPLALLYIVYLEGTGQGHLLANSTGLDTRMMLFLSGPLMTALPLVLLNVASSGMRLSTLGITQYINPLIQMLAATFIIGETLSIPMMVNFIFVWGGLLIYSTNLIGLQSHSVGKVT